VLQLPGQGVHAKATHCCRCGLLARCPFAGNQSQRAVGRTRLPADTQRTLRRGGQARYSYFLLAMGDGRWPMGVGLAVHLARPAECETACVPLLGAAALEEKSRPLTTCIAQQNPGPALCLVLFCLQRVLCFSSYRRVLRRVTPPRACCLYQVCLCSACRKQRAASGESAD
jgi:hypothetical protein